MILQLGLPLEINNIGIGLIAGIGGAMGAPLLWAMMLGMQRERQLPPGRRSNLARYVR